MSSLPPIGADNVIERIVEQNLGVYRASPSRLREDVSQEAQVAGDYRGRLIYELLQNADDAMADAPTANDRVAFLVSDDALWIANTGRALTDADIEGLCGLGASSKIDAAGSRRASIGHKGLGFKSVLEITDEPRVYSRTLCFALGERHARPRIEQLMSELGRPVPPSVPAMRFPAPISAADEQWERYAGAGFNTAFCFPFRDALAEEHRGRIADLLLSLPVTTVLFLKHLESVEGRVVQRDRSGDETWTVARERSSRARGWEDSRGFTESGTYRVSVASREHAAVFLVAHDVDVQIASNRAGLTGPAWDGVELTEVSVATPEPGSVTLPDDWRHFHVFLPTAEPCPYSILVNGAFSTDLSRQRVPISDEPGDYNSHLVRQAARLVVDRLVPLVRETGVESVLRALDRGGQRPLAGPAWLLHEAITEELRDVPLLTTEAGADLSLGEAVLPPSMLGSHGATFRTVLRAGAEWKGRSFPSERLCEGHLAAIAADHGATELEAAESLAVLAAVNDPVRAQSIDDGVRGVEVDPVLELCTAVWQRTSAGERVEVERKARNECLFPVRRAGDRTIERVAVGDQPAFYPPQSARQDLPLRDLWFMCHPICWGALNRNERLSALAESMKAWSSLFGVQEFRFENVALAAILPALRRTSDEKALERRDALCDWRALAAICQLAGRFVKPDRPLRYQRLHSDRALFALSRLPVPCRAGGETRWEPAYKVYFGADWIGDESVELIHDALPHESEAEFAYLAPPEDLVPLLEVRPFPENKPAAEVADDEVGDDEDADQAIEGTARDRWIAFLSWIGVNRALRLVHFHDVEDGATGWLTTKNLEMPRGWAFRNLGATWATFRREIRKEVLVRPDAERVVPFLYEAHDLDQIVRIVDAAGADAQGRVAGALLRHLAAHWARYAAFADCELALVAQGKSPGQRSSPPRALAQERTSGGDNLWLRRLRRSPICATRLGPRRPDATWLASKELERRFAGRGRTPHDLLPVLELPVGLDHHAVRELTERLGVRSEPSPTTFGVVDARLLCEQLERLYAPTARPIDEKALSGTIKPVYRQLFELLSGRPPEAEPAPLSDAPLLAHTADGPRFLPAAELLYAGAPGTRERSGVSGKVPTFVLEAEPAATAPLGRLFGVRRLEDALEWHPSPGERALDGAELTRFRDGLRALLVPLLARIRVERSRDEDPRRLRAFAEQVEPVGSLAVTCTLDGEHVGEQGERSYFVAASGSKPIQAFLAWESAQGWPPTPDAQQALALAMADLLELNLVECFLAFIQSDGEHRVRLLEIAGGSGLLGEVADELTDSESVDAEEAQGTHPEPTTAPGGKTEEIPAPRPRTNPAAQIPLFAFEDLTFDGMPLVVHGEARGLDRFTQSGPPAGGSGSGGGGAGPKAAPGTNLSALDGLGMRIAIAYELRRLQRAGHQAASDDPASGSESLVVPVHTPDAIQAAEEASSTVRKVFAELEQIGVSRQWPGFDILTIAERAPDRFVELKSSGVNAHTQAMTWNEWKSAGDGELRTRFWLYLVGNLRADLRADVPFIRLINDPFGMLIATPVEELRTRRAIQLDVRRFDTAEELTLGVARDGG